MIIINYGTIKHFDIANGPGIRISLFVSGCRFYCKDCFNSEAWDFDYGKIYTEEVRDKLKFDLSNEHITGLSLLGGDPLWQTEQDIELLIDLVKYVKALRKNVWLWSGFTWEEIIASGSEKQRELVNLVDVWVDGRFIFEQRNLNLRYRGSSNQRVIDVQKSLKKGKVVLFEGTN